MDQAKGIIVEILPVVKAEEIRNMQIKIAMILIEPCLDSRLLYNSTTWINIPILYQEKLETTQYEMYQRILGLPREHQKQP